MSKTIFQILMAPKPAAKPRPAPAPAPEPYRQAYRQAKPRSARVPVGVVDARQLSSEDYERRLAQLGLTPPTTDARRGQFGIGFSSGEIEEQDLEGRVLDR